MGDVNHAVVGILIAVRSSFAPFEIEDCYLRAKGIVATSYGLEGLRRSQT